MEKGEENIDATPYDSNTVQRNVLARGFEKESNLR